MEGGVDLRTLPLWHGPKNLIQAKWTQTLPLWQTPSSPYAFWLRWYQSALDGTPQNPDLLRDIALIPDEDWKKGEGHIAGMIAEIEQRHVEAATFNGESIALNPDTGRLYLVPETALPQDIATYARRKMQKARDVFRDSIANQYTALRPDLKLLDDILADAANLPVELYDTCASLSRRIETRVRSGECPAPESDALISDFLTIVRDAGADILSHDPMTQDVLSRRNAIKGNGALVKARDTVLKAAVEIANASEGYLQASIKELADTATSQNADPEQSKVASFKFASRVIRIWSWIKRNPVAAGLTGVLAIGNGILTIEALYNSPLLNAAVQIVLKWAGF